jgi:small GTP-binding protein
LTDDTQLKEQKDETRLLSAYEAIRRREYELINDLLKLLPKIDALPDDRVSQVRDALFHADHPFLMVFVGPFSSGKSSLINALCGEKDLLAVGPVPTTDRISILRYGKETEHMESGGEVATVFNPSPLLKKVSFVDTPGLESVFQKHEQKTRKFLHRSDVVILVMLATQAMTQRNLDYMQELREYGKKVIIVVNQADLLSEDERKQVHQYVLEQSQDRLKVKSEVWMVSSKTGLSAWEGETLNAETWAASGLNNFERYIDEQLDDVQRLRQKLQTPLQIVQNVHKVALEAVRANQAVLDQYQGIAENVEAQLAAYKREQEKVVREVSDQIEKKFTETGERGAAALRDTFQFSRTLGSFRVGLVDLLGLGSLFRRDSKPKYARMAFERHKVYEPIDEVPEIIGKLGPRLEGKDLQDTDDLVKYANREITSLPEVIRDKVIGEIRAPMKYDRATMQSVRPQLEEIENKARVTETDRLDDNVRTTRFALALWMTIIIIGVIAMLLTNFDPVIFIGLFVLAVLGMLMMPIVGYVLAGAHKTRMNALGQEYILALRKAADKQVDYGMRLRRDTVGPLTRLVETQTEIQTEQMNTLQHIDQEMVQVETDLTKLGKKRLFGR